MTPSQVGRLLHEYEASRDRAGDPELEAVRAAVFLEDVFGIALSDAEIDPDVLGTEDGMRAVVLRRRDPG